MSKACLKIEADPKTEDFRLWTPEEKVAVFDIETDGLFDFTKIHCNVIEEIENGDKQSIRYTIDDTDDYPDISSSLSKLQDYDVLIGHNIISYDVRVIKKLFPDWTFSGRFIDTLLLSRLCYPHIRDIDKNAIANGKINEDEFKVYNKFKKKWESAVGKHSLEAWGLRLKYNKGDFGQDTDWQEYTPEMLEYCAQDVSLNKKLAWVISDYVQKKGFPLDTIDLEFQVQDIIKSQIDRGWLFDVPKAELLNSKLVTRRFELNKQLQEACPGWDIVMKTPAYYEFNIGEGILEYHLEASTKGELENKIREYKLGNDFPDTLKSLFAEIQPGPLKVKHIDFNPTSRHHIARFFIEQHGWKPKKKNDDGSWKVDMAMLENLPYPETDLLIEYDTVQDSLEKLSEGRFGGYLTFEENGRLHGNVNTLGALTHRATHSRPNLGQVPTMGTTYGPEMRELFIVSPGYKLVGVDASQQELCCLAHYTFEWDDGKYAEAVASGDKAARTDIHSLNAADVFPIDLHHISKEEHEKYRGKAKTFIYAWLYGAGAYKIAQELGCTKAEAQEIIDRFLLANPAVSDLKQKVVNEYNQKGYVTALDGRHIHGRSAHSALNSLLQCCGAILCKRWMVIIDWHIKRCEYDAHQVGWIHDELQFEVKEDQAELFGQMCVKLMTEVENYYNFKCELSAEYNIGDNWRETH